MRYYELLIIEHNAHPNVYVYPSARDFPGDSYVKTATGAYKVSVKDVRAWFTIQSVAGNLTKVSAVSSFLRIPILRQDKHTCL